MEITIRDKTFADISVNPEFLIGDIIVVTVKSGFKFNSFSVY